MGIEREETAVYERNPAQITRDSFALIQAELAQMGIALPPQEAPIIERMIHSTADYDFATITQFSPGAIAAGVAALRRAGPIVCDVNMVRVGISAARVAALGSALHCFVADERVRPKAAEMGNTRSAAGMVLAHEQGLIDGGIVVIGNAPTALYALLDLVAAGVQPALIVGVPVGFISAVESKAALVERAGGVEFVTTVGRKGGSAVAVAIVNGLLRLAAGAARSETD